MRKISIFIIAILLITSKSFSQPTENVPYFGQINFLKGYAKEISGESIAYTSALPEIANNALLSRTTDGKMAINWQTEPVNFSNEKYIYFAMISGHAQGSLHGDRDFDFFINRQKKFTIHLKKNIPTDSSFHLEAASGESIVFVKKREDGAGDEHGYLYLRIPTVLYEKGKPLQLKIVGQNQNSPDWFMIFKYSLEEKVSLVPLSLITTENKQPIQVQVVHFQKNAKLHLTVNEKNIYDFDLIAGLNRFEINSSTVTKPTLIKVKAVIDGIYNQSFLFELKPITKRTIYLIHHAHYDIGYSDLQEIVKQRHVQNIMNALRYIELTKKLPFEARFKWNIETAYAVDNFLKVCTPEQKQQFIRDVKDGYISIGATYANITSGICQPEVLYNMTAFSNSLMKEMGIKNETAMMSDIPGLTWGTLPALARTGVKYFSDGPNYTGGYNDGDRIGWSSVSWKDKPFWWVSPSGNEKILFWLAGKGYSSWHGTKSGDIFTVGAKKISNYMDELDMQNYPYDMVQWRYNIVADNGPTDSLISKFVYEWNQTYQTPKIVLSTVDYMFKEFEKKYGNQIPKVAGDFTPYWEDGAYSTTKEMVLNNRNSTELPNLSTLYAISKPEKYPTKSFNEAWENILLWKEHTWGAYNSISDPDAEFVKSQWEYKKHFGYAADSIIKELRKPFEDEKKSLSIEVYNTCSWNRSETIKLPYNDSYSIQDENGKDVEVQRLNEGGIAFFAKDIPSLSSRKFVISLTKDRFIPNKQSSKTIKNKNINLVIDENKGGIKSLKYKNFELVDNTKYLGLNGYYYVPGLDPHNAHPIDSIFNLKVIESGNLFSTIAFDGYAQGCNKIHTEITLYNNGDRIEIANTIDKKAVREKESIHYAFPFNISNATERFNTGWGGIFEPGVNQLKGANQDYYSVQQWCDVSNQHRGVSILLNDVNLIEPGEMVDERHNKQEVKEWKTLPNSNPTLFSYVMNNYWHTNYKADQDGEVTIHYTLVPHDTFDLVKVQKEAMASTSPLIVVPAKSVSAASLFTLSNSAVVVSTIIPQENGGYKIRLFNVNDKAEKCSIEWKRLKPVVLKLFKTVENFTQVNPDAVIEFSRFGIVDIECK
jgi:hypothetical protein